MDEKAPEQDVDERLDTDPRDIPFQPVQDSEKDAPIDERQADESVKTDPGASDGQDEPEITSGEDDGAFGPDTSDPSRGDDAPEISSDSDDGSFSDASSGDEAGDTQEDEPDFELTSGENDGDFGAGDGGSSAGDEVPEITADGDPIEFGAADEPADEESDGTLEFSLGSDDRPFGPADPGGRLESAVTIDTGGEGDSEDEGELEFTLTDGNDDTEISAGDGNEAPRGFVIGADGGDGSSTFDDGSEPTDNPTEDGSDDSGPEVAPEDNSEGFEDDEVVPPPDDTSEEPGPAESPDDGSAGAGAGDGDFAPIDFSSEKDPPKEEENEKPEEKPAEKEEAEDGGKLAAITLEPERDPDPFDPREAFFGGDDDDRETTKDDENDLDDIF